ncbi:MAG: hypothetical protein ACE5HI_15535 [bacterium]
MNDFFGVIFGAMGSAGSLISLIFSLTKGKENWKLSASLAVIMLLTGTSAYFSYRYYEVTKSENIKQKMRGNLETDAQAFLNQYPTFTSYWNSGQNEGIAKSGLLILEMYKDLYPENYDKIKSDIYEDVNFAQEHRDESQQRQAMKNAAENVYHIFKTLAAGDNSRNDSNNSSIESTSQTPWFGSKLLYSLLTAVLAFFLSQSALKFVLEPFAILRKIISEIDSSLVFYANVYYNPEIVPEDEVQNMRQEIRRLSTSLRAHINSIPFYSFFKMLLFRFPQKADALKASSFLVGLSNIPKKKNYEDTQKQVKAIRDKLKISEKEI